MGEDVKTIQSGQRTTPRNSARIEKQSAPTDLKKVDRSSLNSALKRAHNYTDDNYDYEASRTIANYFKYSDLKDDFNKLIREYKKRDGSTLTMEKRERKLNEELFKRIRKEYGDDIADEVLRRM